MDWPFSDLTLTMANRNSSATPREDLSVVRSDGTYRLIYVDPMGGLVEKDGTPVPKGSAPPAPPRDLQDIPTLVYNDVPTLVYDDNGTVRPVYRTTGGLVESDGTPIKIVSNVRDPAPLIVSEDTDMPALEDTNDERPGPVPMPPEPQEQLPTLPSLVPDAVATSSRSKKRLAAKANPEPAKQTTTVRHRYLFDLEIDDNGKVIPPPGHKPVQVSPLTLTETISLTFSFLSVGRDARGCPRPGGQSSCHLLRPDGQGVERAHAGLHQPHQDRYGHDELQPGRSLQGSRSYHERDGGQGMAH